ncbi:MAG: glutamine--tRNA ligase/YqeY domain fusion protein [Myxococcota bacterium]
MSESASSNFIRSIIAEDLQQGVVSEVVMRFPPEPNGFLHIGHAKALSVAFGLSKEFGGRCNLRMDDTNPEKEDDAFVEAIERDIRWLGFEWSGRHNASDYFEQLYDWAVLLVKKGLAYVDEQSIEEIRANRGDRDQPHVPGTPGPYRDRPTEESLERLEGMRRGDYDEGSMVLRAKIDLASPNFQLRDPVMYRIKHVAHHRTGDAWHIYPTYDWAHGQSDAIERVTHSTCSLEFDVHRPLYDWFIENLPIDDPLPRQFEFARFVLPYTVMSKRKLTLLVEEGHVTGWDDPRMPTIAGYRRRGVRPEAILRVFEEVGVSKANSVVEPSFVESVIRDDLNTEAPRVMAVLDPIEVVIEGDVPEETLDASYWPHDVPKEATRPVPFSGRVFIERSDFAVDPPKGFKRLAPGRAVRLRYAYVITCTGHETDDAGNVMRIRASIDRSVPRGSAPEGTKVHATIHWVDAATSRPAEVRLYDRLFAVEFPTDDWREQLDPKSLVTVQARVEASLASASTGDRVQFERTGFFVVDEDSTRDALVFNRIVSLRDSYRPKTKPPAKTGAKPKKKAKKTKTVRALDEVGERLVGLGLSNSEAATLQDQPELLALFEAARQAHDNPKGIASWVVSDIARVAKDQSVADLPFDGAAIGKLVALEDADRISHAMGKTVLETLLAEGGDPEAIVEAKGLRLVSDPAVIEPVVAEIVSANPDKVEAHRSGRNMSGFFVGQVLARFDRAAKPQVVQELVARALA